MAITRHVKTPDIDTYQVILEFALAMKALIDDPKALEKSAKASYALSEEEEAKAIKAKQDIATNENILSQQRKQQLILDASIAKLETDKAAMQSSVDSIGTERSRLAKADKALGQRALDLDAKETELAGREKLLADGKDKLAKDTVALNARATRVIEDEASLKEKTASISAILAGTRNGSA